MAISWYCVRLRTFLQEIAAALRPRNDMVIFRWSHLFYLGNRPGWITSRPNQKDRFQASAVIASPQGVAISWYCVRLRTFPQEIAAALRPRNDMVIFRWSHLFYPGNRPAWSAGACPRPTGSFSAVQVERAQWRCHFCRTEERIVSGHWPVERAQWRSSYYQT